MDKNDTTVQDMQEVSEKLNDLLDFVTLIHKETEALPKTLYYLKFARIALYKDIFGSRRVH